MWIDKLSLKTWCIVLGQGIVNNCFWMIMGCNKVCVVMIAYSLSSLLCLDSVLYSFLCPHSFYFFLYPSFYSCPPLYLSARLFWTGLSVFVNICLSFPGRPCQTPKEAVTERKAKTNNKWVYRFTRSKLFFTRILCLCRQQASMIHIHFADIKVKWEYVPAKKKILVATSCFVSFSTTGMHIDQSASRTTIIYIV